MREFYGQLERAGSNMKLIKHYQEHDGERISLWMRLSREPNKVRTTAGGTSCFCSSICNTT